MARLIFGDKRGGQVIVADNLDAFNASLVEIIGDITVQTMLDEAERIAARAREKAPVKSGDMRDGIATFVRVEPDKQEIEVGITQENEDAAEYQFFVRYAKNERNLHKVPPGETPGGHFHWTHIRKPMNAARKALMRRIDEAIAAKVRQP